MPLFSVPRLYPRSAVGNHSLARCTSLCFAAEGCRIPTTIHDSIGLGVLRALKFMGVRLGVFYVNKSHLKHTVAPLNVAILNGLVRLGVKGPKCHAARLTRQTRGSGETAVSPQHLERL